MTICNEHSLMPWYEATSDIVANQKCWWHDQSVGWIDGSVNCWSFDQTAVDHLFT